MQNKIQNFISNNFLFQGLVNQGQDPITQYISLQRLQKILHLQILKQYPNLGPLQT